MDIRAFFSSFVPFMIALVIGFLIIGSSAPFWEMLLMAVVAGIIGASVGQLVRRRGRSA